MKENLDNNTKDTTTKEKIDKLDFIQIKNFCSVSGGIKRISRQTTVWEKTFAKIRVI